MALPEVAKYDAVTGAVLAASDVGGDIANNGELQLDGAITNAAATIVVRTTIPAYWPQPGRFVIDGEVIPYATFAAKTFSGCTRGAETDHGGAAAAAHTDGSTVGYYGTALQYNQLLRDLIAVEKARWNPNLCPNGDFARATIYSLAMPEAFTDLGGTTKIDGGAAGSVAANIFTQGAVNNEYAWCAGSFVWRDGRASATFKATAIGGIYQLRWRIDANNYVRAIQNAGAFTLSKVIAGVNTDLFTAGNVLLVNRWYWPEVEKQASTFIARIYDTGGTTPGVTKASSTLLITGTAAPADASIQAGAHVSISSDQAAAQWGGIATGNGGVYVETWLPEGAAAGFSGVIGGQAVGYDDSVDAGALSKQGPLRVFIPNVSRVLTVQVNIADGSVAKGVPHTWSAYQKTSGTAGGGGTGFNDILMRFVETDSAFASGVNQDLRGSAVPDVVWTPKSITFTTAATTRRGLVQIYFNPEGVRSGTMWCQLLQLEQGSAATAWRNAPCDDAPIVWTFQSIRDLAFAAAAEIDPHDLGANLRFPWDCNVTVSGMGSWDNSGANANYLKLSVDAALYTQLVSGTGTPVTTFAYIASGGSHPGLKTVAGKHRIALAEDRAAGTLTFRGSGYGPTMMVVTAYRGKS